MKASDARLGRFVLLVVLTMAILIAVTSRMAQSVDILNDQGRGTQGMIPLALETQPTLANRWFANTARASAAPVWIIGTSISFRGFDPCELPGIANFSRPAQGLGDVLDWLPEALDRTGGPEEIILEASLAFAGESLQIAADPGTFARLLSIVRLLPEHSGLRRSFAPAPCARRIAPTAPDSLILRPLAPHHEQTIRQAETLAGDLARWCEARPGRRLTLAVFPFNPALPEDERRHARALLDQQADAFFALLAERAPACLRRWSPQIESAVGWYDWSHFMPETGRAIYERRAR